MFIMKIEGIEISPNLTKDGMFGKTKFYTNLILRKSPNILFLAIFFSFFCLETINAQSKGQEKRENQIEVYKIGTMEDHYESGLRRVYNRQTRLIGFENKKGEVTIPASYCKAERFVKKKCAVCTHGTLIQSQSTDIDETYVWDGGKWGIINKKGMEVKPCRYNREWDGTKKCYRYFSDSDAFWLNARGKIIVK